MTEPDVADGRQSLGTPAADKCSMVRADTGVDPRITLPSIMEAERVAR